MDNYNKELSEWENEQKRQYEEFIIDENELETRLVKKIYTFFLKLNFNFFSLQNCFALGRQT